MAVSKKKTEKLVRRSARRGREMIKTKKFAGRYAAFSWLILLSTTLLWSLFSAGLAHDNSDQLVNSYLFEDSSTFHDALFPGAHTFLIKWPLFWLVHLFGVKSFYLSLFTVLVCLVTVGGLGYFITHIEKRPLYHGTILMALASVLMLVPAQPHAGGLLPVNMAMLATRNIEYLLFLGSIFLLLRATGSRAKLRWVALGILTLLIASDKLFATISLGGAILAVTAYGLSRRRYWLKRVWPWLILSFGATILAVSLLALLNALQITHIVSQTTASPYHAVSGLKDLGVGLVYDVMGILTNMGANPAFNATDVKDLPGALGRGIFNVGHLPYLVNLAIVIVGVYFSVKLLASSFKTSANKRLRPTWAASLSLWLLYSSMAAFVAFELSSHYYAVDARYLTIVVFALFIAAANGARRLRFRADKVVLIGSIFCLSTLLAIPVMLKIHSHQKTALAEISERNDKVVQILNQHHTTALVGDYWRVMPIKLGYNHHLIPVPLSGCGELRNVLTSGRWQPDLNHRGFAYLLSLDKGLTDYPTCSMDAVVRAYGRPNSSTLVAGDYDQPKELLLFYDRGARTENERASDQLNQKASAVLPAQLSELASPTCSGRTTMNIVAHEDDDLLFLSPDLIDELTDNDCARTVYLTAGDAGAAQFYWLKRESGSEAAYSEMLDYQPTWVNRVTKLSDHQYVSMTAPLGSTRVSLVFMHLPDGNLHGEGFAATNYESLAKLDSGQIHKISSVDQQSEYSRIQLIDSLTALMRFYHPDEIHTQSSLSGRQVPDHSDHLTVSKLAKAARDNYDPSIPIKFYMGYPVREQKPNVGPPKLAIKERSFLAYAHFDGSVCDTAARCHALGTYGAYLNHQYQNNN